ncbi:phenylalanine--tRNA ligase subunit beta [Halioglobus japonicus]|uniref:Phenylalanine--tRNA ligase beta subunit n=1 Tax=Halioglobus japonicus TaxID=930805 RepID=A0AAP8MHE2_9GAMM|nr:phenylalanine--tRNA ligase subunit beta [Halioglobus japonicus]AQA19414.1 phenylalanine--tRNA ligase subunit beta [Halioglobus japonicus]PLW87532.1 phenylalanine--tRNA ligase subunit beta [Halioglobus japonicus]GHD07973.1 phenylalanine--tRNA ligase beta subunit [Halioglobus japonicus]
MIISEQWLREWVSPAINTEDLAHQITMAGLEVDAIDPVAGDFSGVVVAEIISAEQHPDADKLRVCEVNAGGETVQIVCGAPNARAGLKAPLAAVGGVLPGNFKIKKAKLRGVESFGMLCAEQELGLSDESDGLMELAADAPVGTDIREYLGLDDQVIEIGLTPNRADCLGVAGIAREVGLLNDVPVNAPEINAVAASHQESFPVELVAPERCARFVSRVIRGIDVSKPSPLWMQEKLRRVGLRSIDAVVDVTNYVMMELGQPMHAFDYSKLSGGIRVRLAEQGEELELLDGQTVELNDDTLVIADHDKAVAMAGIMGGQATAVSDATTDLFLEVAFFTPELMAGKARNYGLHTDASHRFERGVDFKLQATAMERATQLLLDIVGGDAGPLCEAVREEHLPTRPDVSLRAARIKKVLGFEMDSAEVERILSGLGLGVTTTADGWTCTVPSWRFDIAIEADLLEELARVYGYNRLPVSHIKADLILPEKTETELGIRGLRQHLAAAGYQEAITYSFVDPKLQQLFDPTLDPVALTNPISADMAVMRTSLLPGLLTALTRNTKRQQPRVRLFETGLRFLPGSEGLVQVPTLAIVITGDQLEEGWAEKARPVDFFDLKGDIEGLLALTRAANTFAFAPGQRDALHPGQTALISRGGEAIGFLGALHPSVAKELGVSGSVYVAEITLSAVLESKLPAFTELSKFPEVRRDLAVLVDKEVPACDILANVRASAGTYLTDLTLFDVYEGKGIDPKRKSLALGLTFRDSSRTLSDQDVNLAVEQVVDSLEKNYKAELRN